MTLREFRGNLRWRPPWSKRCRWVGCVNTVEGASRVSIVDSNLRTITSAKLCDTHLARAINTLTPR